MKGRSHKKQKGAGRFAAAIHLVHVYESGYPTGLVVPSPPFSLTPYEQEAKEKVGGELEALAHKYGIPAARYHVLSGTPAFNEICGLTGQIRTDLIVMPTHARTGLEHRFLGSTAERTVRHSPCPVFVMRQRREGVSETKAAYKRSLFLSISPVARVKDCGTLSESRVLSGRS